MGVTATAIGLMIGTAVGALAGHCGGWVDNLLTRITELFQTVPAFVGAPKPSAPLAVLEALANGLVPVVSPLARGPLNVNADEMASALAVGIGARKISFLTDVAGVYRDGELVRTIEAENAESLVDEGVFEGGIVPKLLAAALAAKHGVTAEIGAAAVVA